MRRVFAGMILILLLSSAALAQSTFRGGLAGMVTDPQGAIIPAAKIEATDLATGVVYKTVSSSAGDYSISDLPLGDYSVVVAFTGFSTVKVDQVRISAGQIFSLPVKLEIATTTTTVEVQAAALTLDTTNQVNTFSLPKEEVSDVPINGRSFTQMTSMLPGNTTGTTRDLIDGVDNNDAFSNSSASNQGGVDGIPGTLLPLDSVEEFSAEQQNGVESGGFSGTVVNLSIKSGTNKIHGSAYYFNRNEFFARLGPFTKYFNATDLAAGKYVPKKPAIHFQEYGGSVGGPILKDRMFYFLNYERQQYVLGQGETAQTEPSAAYVADALALIEAGNPKQGVPAGSITPATNPSITMGENLITTLWQPNMLTGGAQPQNWVPPASANQNGYSNNVMMKFDQTLNSKNKISERWYYGFGKQTAPLGTSQNPWYYQVGPERVDNVAVTLNTALNARTSNQILMGVDFYNQPFGDAKPNNGAAAVGFIAGVGPGDTYGQPGIAISGFDGTGGTTIQDRRDFSGHLTETLSRSLGKHQLRAGAEYRRQQIYAEATGAGSSSVLSRGSFSFSGSRGLNAPSGGNGVVYLSTDPTTGVATTSQTKALADYLLGESSSATLYNGDLDRNVSDNNFNIFGQDNFQITQGLNITYGLRWDYWSPAGDDQSDFSVFRPGTAPSQYDLTGGLAVVGQDIKEPYKSDALQIAPRVGFSWQPSILPSITKGMVVRAGIGLYFDTTALGSWLSVSGLAGNPAGMRPLYNEGLTSPNILPNVSIFPANAASSIPNNGAGGVCTGVKVQTCPNLSIASVDQNYSMGNTTNMLASVEKALGNKAIIAVSYVGERGRHLKSSWDLNQPGYGSTTNTAIATNSSNVPIGFSYSQTQRPYFTQYPNFAKIAETSSIGSSDANAFQAYIRTRGWHGLISEVSYALSTSNGTGSIEDYNNPFLDYGSNSVVTNQLKGYWDYTIPSFKHGPSWLASKWVTGGWQTSGTIVFKGAGAVTAGASATCNSSVQAAGTNTYALTCSGLGVGEAGGRADLTGLPRFCPKGNCGGTLANGATGTSRSKIVGGAIQWYNPYAVISPPGCSVVIAGQTNGASCSQPLTSYYGTTKPGQIHGAPGFKDIDLSVFKNFPITEKIKGQFRGEMYNFFNWVNLSKPSLSASNTATDFKYFPAGGSALSSNNTSTGQITTTIGGTSDPGITEGEPFNCQLALKIIF